MKQLAIIIPAYNASISLNRLLSQIVGQCTDQVEIIVVDDGSSDDTLSVAQSYLGNGVVAVHQDNAGVSSARNRGMQECSAQYIWFVDSDDYIKSDSIQTLLSVIEQESADCYLFGFEKHRGDAVTTMVNRSSQLYATKKDVAEHIDEIFSDNLINPLWNKLFKREIITDHGISFEKLESGEDVTFVLQYLSVAQSLYVLTNVLYEYEMASSTSSSRIYHAGYAYDESRMFEALQSYCDVTGADANVIYERWRKELTMGVFVNAFNGMGKRKNYIAFRRLVNEQRHQLTGSAAAHYRVRNGLRSCIVGNSMAGYCLLRARFCVNSFKARLHEIRRNPGLLPKILVFILRFGMWAERLNFVLFRFIFLLIYRIVDLMFCKLLLNCDISAKTDIGDGFTVYHPYGIFINSNSVIGTGFICRGQVTIGNKGTEVGDGCPRIGNDVNVGVGAKIIGPISIGNNCSIGANAVVTRSFPAKQILVGVPANAK